MEEACHKNNSICATGAVRRSPKVHPRPIKCNAATALACDNCNTPLPSVVIYNNRPAPAVCDCPPANIETPLCPLLRKYTRKPTCNPPRLLNSLESPGPVGCNSRRLHSHLLREMFRHLARRGQPSRQKRYLHECLAAATKGEKETHLC